MEQAPCIFLYKDKYVVCLLAGLLKLIFKFLEVSPQYVIINNGLKSLYL